MDGQQLNLLKQIQEMEFVNIELVLFLDTHPNDQNALRDYTRVTQQLKELKRRYEERYGPLTVHDFTPATYPWQWVEQPWPWEIEYR